MKLIAVLLAAAAFASAENAPKPTPSFHVDVTGTGRPIILIPGLSSSGHVYDTTVAHLKDHYQCHVLTLAGFAGQPPIPAPFLSTVRDDLAAYIRTNKLDHPVIIGHSLGGTLAIDLASREPDLTGPIVIIDALPFLPAVFDPKATAATMKPMGEQMRTGMSQPEAFLKQSEAAVKEMVTRPEDVATVMEWVKTTDPATAGQAMFEFYTTDLRPDTAKIRVPVLVLGTWIAYKQYTTREAVLQSFETQYAQVGNRRILLADNARHFIMLDDPQWFFTNLDAFLAAPGKLHE